MTLDVLLVLYLFASLLHFVHNATYIAAYPNLPSWITPTGIYATWVGITSLGVAGYVLHRKRFRLAGKVLLCVYAAAGLAGLLHYALAPAGAHTHGMNFTIGVEAAVATALLIHVLRKVRLR